MYGSPRWTALAHLHRVFILKSVSCWIFLISSLSQYELGSVFLLLQPYRVVLRSKWKKTVMKSWRPTTTVATTIVVVFVIFCASAEAQKADPFCRTGIINRGACCPIQCGKCGDAECYAKSLALKTSCCVKGIISSNAFCSNRPPPCRLAAGRNNQEPAVPPPQSRGVRHDTTTGRWWTAAVQSGYLVRRHEACAVMVNGLVVLVGGRGVNKATSLYNPQTKTWWQGAGPGNGVELHHMQCVSVDGKVWVVSSWRGPYPFEKNNDAVYVYDVARNVWSTRAGMVSWRNRGGSAVVRLGDWIYVVAGARGGHGAHATSLTWFDAYNWRTDTWLPPGSLPNMPGSGRDHVGAAFVGGVLCVAGGRDGGTANFFQRNVATTFCYNFGTRAWSQRANFPLPRAGAMTGTTCDGRMMIAGGEGNGRAYSRVDVFDGAVWTQAPSLVQARHGSGLAISSCNCGHIFIPSGSGAQGGSPELYSTEHFISSTSSTQCSNFWPTSSLHQYPPLIRHVTVG